MASHPQPQLRRQTGLEEVFVTLTDAGRPDLVMILSSSLQQQLGHHPDAALAQGQLFGSLDPLLPASSSVSFLAPFGFPTIATTAPDLTATHAPDSYCNPESDGSWSSASPSTNPSTASPATIQDNPYESRIPESDPLMLSGDPTLVEPLESMSFFPGPVYIPPPQWPADPGVCLETLSQQSNFSCAPASSQLPFDGLDVHTATSDGTTLTLSYGSLGYDTEALGYPAGGASAIQSLTEASGGFVLSDVEVSLDQPEGFSVCTFVQNAPLTAGEALCGGHLPTITSSSPVDDVYPARGSSYPSVKLGKRGVARKVVGPSEEQKDRALKHRRDIKNVNKPSKGKKCGPLAKINRDEAKQTRKSKACARCYLNKQKCFVNDQDPNGICSTCVISNPNTYVLPCIRLKITDIMLFRLGPTEQFIKAKRWLDDGWNTISTWQSHDENWMTLTQDGGQTSIRVMVKRFYPMEGDTLTKLHDRYTLQHVPFAIADVPATVEELRRHIRDASESYIQDFTRNKSPILRKTFSMISSLIKEPKGTEHIDLLKGVLDLWVANRFIERPWHVPQAETLDPMYHHFDSGIHGHFRVPISPVMDHQLDQIVIQKILNPLKQAIQKKLQKLMEMNKKNNWLINFLCSFIILYNYEAATVHDLEFVRINGLQTRFSDDSLIQSYHIGAKTLLTYFRYYCKGQVPFQLDYQDGNTGKLTPFNEEQKVYMTEMIECISNQADYLKTLENPECYKDELHLVSKLFRKDWELSPIFSNLQ